MNFEVIKKHLFKNYFFNEKIYLLIFSIYHFTLILDISMIPIEHNKIRILCKLIRYICYLFFAVKIGLGFIKVDKSKVLTKLKNLNKFQILIILTVILYFIFLMINLVITRNMSLMFYTLVYLSGYDIVFSKIVRTMEKSLFRTMIFLTTLCVLGLTKNFVNLRPDGGVRNSIGYFYVLQASHVLLLVLIYRLYLNKFKMSFRELGYFQLINTLISFLTDARTSFIFIEIIILFTFIMNVLRKLEFNKIRDLIFKIINKLTVIVLPFYIAGSIGITLIYGLTNFRLFYYINRFLSNRLAQMWHNFNRVGVTLLGNKMNFYANSAQSLKSKETTFANFIDNEYVDILFVRGIILFILLMCIIYITIILLNRKSKSNELFIMLVLLTFGLLNPTFIQITFSVMGFLIVRTLRNYLFGGLKNESI